MHFGISPAAAIAGAGEGGEGGGGGGEREGEKEEKQEEMQQEKHDGVGKKVEGVEHLRKSRRMRRNRRTLMHFHHQIQGRGQGRPRLMHQRKRNYCCIARILMRLREKCNGCVANIAQISMHLSTFNFFKVALYLGVILSRLPGWRQGLAGLGGSW